LVGRYARRPHTRFIVPNEYCLATLAHRLWVRMKVLLHRFEQMLVLPMRNPAVPAPSEQF
jgi:hypothetical protein